MVFRTGITPKSSDMLPATPKMPPDSTCLLCCSALKKSESALTRSRWMCAHCYAQLELLDKYERDRRQLEQKAATIQGELVNTFRYTTSPASAGSPPQPAAPSSETPVSSSVVAVSSAVSSSTIVLAPGADEDDPTAEEDGASDPEDELYPLAGELVDVKQEMAGSDGEDVDLDEDVPASDPLADCLDDVDDGSNEAGTPIVNVAAPVISVSPSTVTSGTTTSPQLPVLLQGSDGKLYMLPTGTQPAVSASGGAPGCPLGPVVNRARCARSSFLRRLRWTKHLRNHSMVCSGCDHLFASRVALFEHRQTCVPARPAPLPTPPPLPSGRSRSAFCCNLCPAVAPDTAALNEHAAQAHGLLYRCPKCDCRTAELLQYAHHVRSGARHRRTPPV
ncbi:hypothetical protein FJT64_018523 [Amphibalanus amphitrite]|uniref:C2H2-type domain-containing protein n=1 Tax=Amphibalanus amphitrite TaxID=1232801 RepID=A0A6A4X314_AMPAM|nr:hypothetical protein FJT64_018523 [Amphibalanus amphitrite]